jgi:two-component system chemotaxis response regulator CheB
MTAQADPVTDQRKRRLRVLVVDDSTVQRGVLVALLDSDPDLEVVGWASSGEDSIKAAARLRPDVITMDLRMPGMDGLAATRRIMQESPTPIVLVTGSVSRQDQQVAFEAFQAGILAIAEKPLALTSDARAASELLSTIKSMAQLKVVRRWSPERLQERLQAVAPPVPILPPVRPATGRPEVVAIGASTGGPQALRQILSRLPANFPAPILVVQHIAAGFVGGMVDWLKPQCSLPIQLATPGVPLTGPGVLIAPTGRHLVVRNRSLALTDDPPIGGHRPSATVLLQSVARAYGSRAVGILLTGMGDDGAIGLREMQQAGAVTVAQDEASSVVFGMPGVAVQLGAADHVLPPTRIADLLLDVTGSTGPDLESI